MHTIYKTYSISYAQNKIDFENIKGRAKILYMTFGVRSTIKISLLNMQINSINWRFSIHICSIKKDFWKKPMMMLAPIAPRPNYTFFEFYIILFCMLTKFHGISRKKNFWWADLFISFSYLNFRSFPVPTIGQPESGI